MHDKEVASLNIENANQIGTEAPTNTAISPASVTPPSSITTSGMQSYGSVALPSGRLPDEPYTKAVTQYPKRYYADTMLGLVASNKYGQIVPYIGERLWSGDTEIGNAYAYLYGLCDLSGRIVCDPLYNNVSNSYHIGLMIYCSRHSAASGKEQI